MFFSIGGMIATPTDELFVTDPLGFKVRKFDKNGRHKKSIGSKGEAPHEFRTGPTRLAHDPLKRRIAVVDNQLPVIKIFDEELNYERSLFTPAPVVDLVYDDRGRLIVAAVPSKGALRSITMFDQQGGHLKSFDPKDVVNGSYVDAFSIDFNKRHRKIVVVFFHRNIVQILSAEGEWVRQFSIPGLPEKARTTRKRFGDDTIELPENFLFWDVASDTDGNIYVLGAHSSKNQNRDVYILGINGESIGSFTLPTGTGRFSVGYHGTLITQENHGTAVAIYQQK